MYLYLGNERLILVTFRREGRDQDDCQVDVDEALTELVQAHYVERSPLMGSATLQARKPRYILHKM